MPGGRGSPKAPEESYVTTQTAGGTEVLDAGAWHKRTTKEKRLAKKRRILADKEELKAYRATSSGSKGKSEGKGRF